MEFLYILFGFLLSTIINNFIEIVNVLSEWVKAKIGVSLTKSNNEITKLANEVEEKSRKIGFRMDDEENG